MAPEKPTGRSISQQAFDEMVKENIDDLGMEPMEALSDAIETLTLQGVDLSGVITTALSGETNPLIQSLDRIKQLQSSDWTDEAVVDEALGLLDNLTDLSRVEGSGNAAIATRNGGIELMCSICSKLRVGGRHSTLASALNVLAAFLHDLKSTETFRQSGGPKMLVGILSDGAQNANVLNSGFSVVAAAATGNEVVKESFVELHIDELMIAIMRKHSEGSIPSLYDAIRVLLAADDDRVVASQVYGYARQFAKIGIAEALAKSLKDGLSSPNLVSATIALKAVAVNDEICKSVAENDGIDSLLTCIDDSGVQGNHVVAKACCSLLSKLAGSDSNKSAIVEKGGLNKLITLSSRLADDPSVIQENQISTRLQSIVAAQDEKIANLTSQVNTLSDSIASIKDILNDLPNSLEKLILNLLRKEEKKPIVTDESSSDTIIIDEGKSGPERHHTDFIFRQQGPSSDPLFSLPKVQLPIFDGIDPRGWLSKAELYFQVHKTSPNSRLSLTQMCMDGPALHWFTNLLTKSPNTTWDEFKSKFMVRFSGTIFHNLYEALGSLFQDGFVDDYIDEFESLLALIPNQTEEQSVGLFLRGLRCDIRNWVRTLNPSTCSQAMDLARNIEMALGGQTKGYSYQGRPAHYGKSNMFIGINSNTPARSLPVLNDHKATFPTKGTRHLTKQEWEDRRRKGLCFGCGQKYSPQHKCTDGGLRIMLLSDGEVVGDDGEIYNLGEIT